MQFTGANDDLAQDVVLLGDGDDAGGLAEDVLDHLGASFDPLAVVDHQQGDVLVDLVGFLRDPQQRAALADLVAMLGGTGLLDRQAGREAHDAPGLGAEAVVGQLGDHLAAADLAAGLGLEQVADVVLALQVPDLTGVGGFTHELAVLEGKAGGDDLHLAGIPGALAQPHGAAVFALQTALGQHLAGGHRGVGVHHRQGVGRQVVDVAAEHPEAAEALGLVGDVALPVGDLAGLDHVLKAHLTGQVADHVLGGLLDALLDLCARGDLGEHRIGGDAVAVVDEQDRTGGDVELVGLALAARLHGQHEVGFGQVGLHPVRRAVGTQAGLGAELDHAFLERTHHTGLSGGHAAGVEGAHGQLGARLTDRLGGDDADGLAQIDELVVGQGPAVAVAAHRAGGLAGERRAHHHRAHAGLLDRPGEGGVDLAVAIDDDAAIGGQNGLGGQTTDQLAAEAALLIGVDRDAAGGAAVLLPHDHVLGHIHQTAGEIAGVGGAQGGVHQALAGAVGGDDVFGDRQALAEVGADRQVDDLPLRVGHQAAHADQLTHLRHVAAGAGVGHHPDRVERIVLVEVPPHSGDEALVGLGPGVDHLGVALHFGDLTEPVTLFGFGDLLLGLLQQGRLVAGDAQIVHRDRHGGLGGVVEAQVLELVGHRRGGSGAVVLVGPGHQIAQGLLVDDPVAERGRLAAQGRAAGLGCHVGGRGGGLALLAGLLGGGGGHGRRSRRARGEGKGGMR